MKDFSSAQFKELCTVHYALSPAEARALTGGMRRCACERDPVLRQMAVTYVQGMCSMLRAQERLTCQSSEEIVAKALADDVPAAAASSGEDPA